MDIERNLTPDSQLIFAAGDDPDAFRCLYDRYAPRLYRFFVRRCADSDVAVDLTAETFAQAWVSKRRFRDVAGGTAVSRTSFHCTLATAPTGEAFYNQDGSRAHDVFLGMTAETVDEHKRVDGACVSISADGRSWNCYLGDAAVTRGLLSRDYLGTYLPEPPTA
jgi:hypothetical protein